MDICHIIFIKNVTTIRILLWNFSRFKNENGRLLIGRSTRVPCMPTFIFFKRTFYVFSIVLYLAKFFPESFMWVNIITNILTTVSSLCRFLLVCFPHFSTRRSDQGNKFSWKGNIMQNKLKCSMKLVGLYWAMFSRIVLKNEL